MEWIFCDLCGANDTDLLYAEKDRLHRLEGVFYLVRCRRCGLIYINPRPTPEEMSYYYPDNYHAYKTPDRKSLIARLDYYYGMHKRCKAVVTQWGLRSGKILDIGCSFGGFLDFMRRYGEWELYGVEINAEAASYANRCLGLNVFTGTLQDAHYPDDFFDIITLWNVFEHLHYPKATLLEISRIIRQKGLLVLSLPNPHSIEARIFGPYWAGLDAPRHLYIYTLDTLNRALNLAGFTIKKVVSFSGHHSVLSISMGFWIDEKIPNELLRQWSKRAINSLPVRLLTIPYYIIADYLRQTSVITVFAVRC